jgi:hypothetical protein
VENYTTRSFVIAYAYIGMKWVVRIECTRDYKCVIAYRRKRIKEESTMLRYACYEDNIKVIQEIWLENMERVCLVCRNGNEI